MNFLTLNFQTIPELNCWRTLLPPSWVFLNLLTAGASSAVCRHPAVAPLPTPANMSRDYKHVTWLADKVLRRVDTSQDSEFASIIFFNRGRNLPFNILVISWYEPFVKFYVRSNSSHTFYYPMSQDKLELVYGVLVTSL